MSEHQDATAPGRRRDEKREAAADRLEQALARREEHGPEEHDPEELENLLWDTLVLFQGYPFRTAKNLEFTYLIKGNEMFVSRKEKSLTRASVMLAFWKALEMGRMASGPKKLGTFGASYLYPIFLHLNIIFRM